MTARAPAPPPVVVRRAPAPTPGGPVTAASLLALQRSAGNAAAAALLQRDVDTESDLDSPLPGGTDDLSTFCVPFSTKREALRRRKQLFNSEILPLTAVLGSATGELWRQYVFGGAAPQEIVDPEIIRAFAIDSATKRATRFVMARILDGVRAKPDIDDGTHAVEEFLPVGQQADLEKEFSWRNPLLIPGSIAGGVGKNQEPIGAQPSPVLDDSRVVRGSVILETDEAGNRTARIKPVVSVDDTLDFCPGNPGIIPVQPFTKPLSKCEASLVSGDVPFHLTFTLPPAKTSIRPKPEPAPPPKPITIPSSVLFGFDSAAVTPAGEEALVLALGDRPQRADLSQRVKVVGHTDAKGPEAYNQDLSERRANAVARVLERRFPQFKGFIDATGRGEQEPVAPNEIDGQDSPEGRRLNRRVVVELASTP